MTLTGNNIVILPPQIANLKSLVVLDLSRNDIRFVPKGIGELSALQTLDLRLNDVKDIDSNLSKLTQLKVLNLQGMFFSDEMKQKISDWLPNIEVQFSGGCDCGF